MERGQSGPLSAGRDAAQRNSKVEEIRINGAGSTTIDPLLSAWIDEYNRLHRGIRIAYQAIGSLGGIRALIAGQISFGASEVPMTDEQLAQAKGRILHFPVALRAVVPAYNLQVPELRFSGNTLADIFLGKITRWDDPAIAGDNPGVNLPKIEIKVVHQFPHRDGTAAVAMAADYLAKISSAFKEALDKSDGRSCQYPPA
jgi:phosphate transport system substrate-binding protein